MYGYCICVWDASGQSNITTFSPLPLGAFSLASFSAGGVVRSSFVSLFAVFGEGDGTETEINSIDCPMGKCQHCTLFTYHLLGPVLVGLQYLNLISLMIEVIVMGPQLSPNLEPLYP